MKKMFSYFIMLGALSAFLLAHANFAYANSNQGDSNKIGDQFEINKVLAEEMKNNPDFEGTGVSASFLDGYITLNGYVDNLWQKQRLIKISQNINGARGVIDKLKIVSSSLDSETLAKKVALALFKDEVADIYELQVVTDDYGRVELTGSVDSQEEAQAAQDAAAKVKGVLFANNKIKIGKKEKRSDSEIEKDLEFALYNNVLIDESLLQSKVDQGKATVSGAVGSEVETAQVEKLTSEIPGVSGANVTAVTVIPRFDRSVIFKVDSLNDSYTDKELAKNVDQANYYDTRVFSYNIDVEAKNGVVELSGTAKDANSKEAALENAKNTVGVKEVSDKIEVDPYAPEQELAE